MRSSQLFRQGVFLFLFASSSPALAQSVAPATDRYEYHFDDDYMVGDTLATTPPLIRGSTKRPRVMLLRARASFVPELLKSVEIM